MIKALGLAAVAVLMTATSALADEPQADQAAQQEKKICKTEKMTGSLTRVRRTCLTQRQWDELAESTRRDVNTTIRNASNNTGGSSNGGS